MYSEQQDSRLIQHVFPSSTVHPKHTMLSECFVPRCSLVPRHLMLITSQHKLQLVHVTFNICCCSDDYAFVK
jgi:hypothetical protein